MPGKKRVRRAAAASPETVRLAEAKYRAADMHSQDTVERYLDTIGFRDFHDHAHVVLLSDAAGQSVKLNLSSSQTLVREVLKRIAQCGDGNAEAGSRSISYLWLAQCAGWAIQLLPVDDSRTVELLEQAAFMPLNNDRHAGITLRSAIARHEACPPDILYWAAMTWPLYDARRIQENPQAPEVAKVAIALRS